jgi:hypothetical protein
MSRTPQQIAVEMLTTGLTQQQLTLLVELQSAYASICRQSADASADARRKRDAEYQRNKRKTDRETRVSAKANDVAAAPATSADGLPTIADEPLSFFSEVKKLSEEVSKKEAASVVEKPGRGTRLSPDWQPSKADRQFAVDHGVNPETLRDEFVDFWTSIPGQRGCKVGERGWSSTWRNRIRAICGKTGASNGKTGTIVGAQQKLIGRLAELNRPAPSLGASAIRSGEGGNPVRLISKG